MSDTTTATAPAKPVAPAKNSNPKVLKPTQPKVAEGQKMPLKKEDNFKTSFSHPQPKVVKSTYTMKLSKDDKDNYGFTTDIDFNGCSQEEILELAASSVRITIQRKLRDMGRGALASGVMTSINVKNEIIEAQRQSVDDLTKAVRALMSATNLSQEAALKIILDNKKVEKKA